MAEDDKNMKKKILIKEGKLDGWKTQNMTKYKKINFTKIKIRMRVRMKIKLKIEIKYKIKNKISVKIEIKIQNKIKIKLKLNKNWVCDNIWIRKNKSRINQKRKKKCNQK